MEKGVIYYEGTVKMMQQLTGWSGGRVLYFGDHPYSDLADVTLGKISFIFFSYKIYLIFFKLDYSWRTGAIINELSVR